MGDPDGPVETVGERPTSPRRRVLTFGALLLVLLLLLALADAGLAARQLRVAESEARTARAALAAGGLQEAVEAVEEASHAARAADRRLSRGHWRAAERLPGVGDDVAALRALAATGAVGAGIAEDVLAAARPLVDEGASAVVVDGRLQLGLLTTVADALSDIDLAELDRTRSRLTMAARAPLTDTLDDAVDRVLDVAAELADAVPVAADGVTLLVDLLGGDGPRRYLVAVQNPGELRGTGGLIGFLAVLELDDGEVLLAEPTGIDTDTAIDGTVLVPLGAFSRSTRFDVVAPEDYQTRYGSVGGAIFLPSTNVDPDLPTVAPLVLAQYEQASGEPLDGVLAIDPIGLQLLFQAIGSLDVPASVAGLSPELPDPIPADDLAEVLLIDSYEVLGGGSPERRRYHAEVAGAALRTVLGASWEPLATGRALRSAAAARHLQVYSTDPDEQRRLGRFGLAGALTGQQDGDDLLAVTVVNIGGNKADVHVAHELQHDLDLEVVETGAGAELWRRSTSTLRIVNAVDADSDPYIATSLEPTRPGDPRVSTGQVGLVRSWVTLWSPPGSTLVDASDLTGADIVTWRDPIHGLETVDHLLATPRAETTGVEVELRGPTGVVVDGDRLTYPLTLWRQAKGIVDHLDVTIAPPSGWEITAVEVASAGPAVGLGPAPFTAPVAIVDQNAGVVHLRGSMTADVRVELDLRRLS